MSGFLPSFDLIFNERQGKNKIAIYAIISLCRLYIFLFLLYTIKAAKVAVAIFDLVLNLISTLRECVEKLQLLNTPEERSRRLQEIPEVHTDPNMDPSYESEEEEAEADDRRGLWF